MRRVGNWESSAPDSTIITFSASKKTVTKSPLVKSREWRFVMKSIVAYLKVAGGRIINTPTRWVLSRRKHRSGCCGHGYNAARGVAVPCVGRLTGTGGSNGQRAAKKNEKKGEKSGAKRPASASTPTRKIIIKKNSKPAIGSSKTVQPRQGQRRCDNRPRARRNIEKKEKEGKTTTKKKRKKASGSDS